MFLFSNVFFFFVHFEFFAVLSYCNGRKSPAGTRQTGGKYLIWFGEIERKFASTSSSNWNYQNLAAEQPLPEQTVRAVYHSTITPARPIYSS